jgi:hypothetical protein
MVSLVKQWRRSARGAGEESACRPRCRKLGGGGRRGDLAWRTQERALCKKIHGVGVQLQKISYESITRRRAKERQLKPGRLKRRRNGRKNSERKRSTSTVEKVAL